jgi:hypothetical protein
MTTAAKTKISQTGTTVTATYDDTSTGTRVTRNFFAKDGTVHEALSAPKGATRQVCAGLKQEGTPVAAPEKVSQLLDVIRAEYKSMREEESWETT